MAVTQATTLADFTSGIGTAGAVLQVDNVDQRIGIGTTDPQGTLQVGIAITMDGTAGVITASSFSGSGGNLTFTGADISAATGTFTGNVSVGGTLTYEDVTNIDAVGVITAQSDVVIADKIIHLGDTNTAIRFPAADTFTVETGGSEALRVDSSQRLLVGSTSARANFFDSSHSSNIQVEGNTTTKSSLAVIRNDNGDDGSRIFFAKSRGTGDTIVQDDDRLGAIEFQGNDGGGFVAAAHIASFVDATPGSNDMPARLVFSTTADGASSPTERLRIDSSGNVLVAKTTTALDTAGSRISSGFISLSGDSSSTNLAANAGGALSLANADSTDNNFSNIGGYNSNGLVVSQIDFINKSHSSRTGDIAFLTHNGTSLLERVRIDSSGNMGLGTASPAQVGGDGAAVFHIAGDANPEIVLERTTSGTEFKGSIRITDAETMTFAIKDGGAASVNAMVLDNSGRLLVNASSSTQVGSIDAKAQIVSSDFNAALAIRRNQNGDGGASVLLCHSRGTSNSANVLVNNGDSLGNIRFFGADATGANDFAEGAAISATVDGTPGSNDMPTRLEFKTTADGASSPTERMRIHSSGGMSLGTTATPTALSQATALRLGTSTLGHHTITNLSTTVTDITAASGIGGLAFVQLFNTSNGAQYVGLHQWRYGHLVTISESNNTGLTLNFSVSTNTLRLATSSGTVSGSVITLQAST